MQIGLANRVVADGTACEEAQSLALEIRQFPQLCMRNDRLSAYEQWDLQHDAAIANEFQRGMTVVQSGETVAGASRFAGGAGRHGAFDE